MCTTYGKVKLVDFNKISVILVRKFSNGNVEKVVEASWAVHTATIHGK